MEGCPVWSQCMEQGRGWRPRGEAGGQLRQTIRLSRAGFQTSVNIPGATVVREGTGVGPANEDQCAKGWRADSSGQQDICEAIEGA